MRQASNHSGQHKDATFQAPTTECQATGATRRAQTNWRQFPDAGRQATDTWRQPANAMLQPSKTGSQFGNTWWGIRFAGLGDDFGGFQYVRRQLSPYLRSGYLFCWPRCSGCPPDHIQSRWSNQLRRFFSGFSTSHLSRSLGPTGLLMVRI